MKKITFVSRRIAAAMTPPPDSVLISIHDISEPQLTPAYPWLDVLYLQFHDTDGQHLGLEVFSKAQAQACLAFAGKYEHCQELVVHCQMGQSRSAGVALFLSELLAVPCFKESLPVDASSYRLYNRKVYSTLYSACHGDVGTAFADMPVEPG